MIDKMTYLTSEWGLRDALRNARAWYSTTVSPDATAFQNWLAANYDICVVLLRARDNITDYPVTSYRWEVEYINDKEKATLFKLQWS